MDPRDACVLPGAQRAPQQLPRHRRRHDGLGRERDLRRGNPGTTTTATRSPRRTMATSARPSGTSWSTARPRSTWSSPRTTSSRSPRATRPRTCWAPRRSPARCRPTARRSSRATCRSRLLRTTTSPRSRR
ncbi:hypothetical protein NKG05_20340 [Oerskovia sp. M15]